MGWIKIHKELVFFLHFNKPEDEGRRQKKKNANNQLGSYQNKTHIRSIMSAALLLTEWQNSRKLPKLAGTKWTVSGYRSGARAKRKWQSQMLALSLAIRFYTVRGYTYVPSFPDGKNNDFAGPHFSLYSPSLCLSFSIMIIIIMTIISYGWSKKQGDDTRVDFLVFKFEISVILKVSLQLWKLSKNCSNNLSLTNPEVRLFLILL